MEPLRYVRKAVAPYVAESGKFEGDPEVLETINEARRIIYPLGDWKDTVQPLALQVQGGIITLPPWADYIRKSWLGCQHLDITDEWYQSVEDTTFTRCCGRFIEGGLIDLGERFCTFKDYTKNFRIKVISLDQRDAGVRLVFHGTSEYGEPVLLTRILDQPNIPVVSDPINDKWVKSITYCEKPLTHDRVYVYIYDPLRSVDTLCAIYEATDINPRFRRYRVPRCGSSASQVFTKAKKKWVELANDDELVDIHTDTLIHLLQAITSRMNRDMAGYIAGVKAARQYEDRRLLDASPIRSFTMKMSPIYHETNLGFDV